MSRSEKTRKRKQKTRKQKGSAFVAKGSYGCVFNPAFRCEGNAAPMADTVTKVMNMAEANKEYGETRFLQALDPEFRYYIYPVSLCLKPAVRTNDEKAENPFKACETNRYSNNRLATKELSLLQIPYGGVDMLLFKQTSIARLMEGWSHLLEGLAILHRQNRVHMDIKPMNIVCKDMGPAIPVLTRYIDFGLSFKTNTDLSDDLQRRFLTNYTFWPYEVRFLSRAYFGYESITDESVMQYIQISSEWAKSLVPPMNPALNANFYRNLWNKFQGYARVNFHLVQDFIGKATDIYALGKTFCIRYSRMTRHLFSPTGQIIIPFFETKSKEVQQLHRTILESVSQPLYYLCQRMMHEDPFQRPQIPYIQLELMKLARKMSLLLQ